MKISTRAVALALLAVSSSTSAVAASLSHANKNVGQLRRLDKDDDDDKPKKPKHDCELETKGTDKVEFECKSKTENEQSEIKDKIKFKISQDDKKGLKVKVEYEQETELNRRSLQDVEETEVKNSFEANFAEVIEYRKSTTTAGRRLTASEQAYVEGDEIVSRISLKGMSAFSSPDVTTRRRRLQDGGEEDDTVYAFSIATEDEVAKFDFYITKAGGQDPNVQANSMTIDVTMKDYPYQQEGTNLAIVSTVESEQEIKVEYADEESQDNDKDDEKDEDGKDEADEDKKDSKDDEQDGGSETAVESEEKEDEDDEDGDRRRSLMKVTETTEILVPFGNPLIDSLIPFGEFSWIKTAEAGNFTNTTDEETLSRRFLRSDSSNTTETPNNTTETPMETETIQVVAVSGNDGQVVFSFVGSAAQGASYIFWDPETGVDYATSDDERFSANGSGGSAAPSKFWQGNYFLTMAMTVGFVWIGMAL